MSGTSAVAIDNKIEQAMVRGCYNQVTPSSKLTSF